MKTMYPIRWSMIARGCLVAGVAAAALQGIALANSIEDTPPLPWDAGILGEAQPLDLRSASLDVQTEGPAYQATLELNFRNPRSSVVEGVAFLPIAADAVERGFLADNNGLIMEGQVRSRDRVIRVYRDITRRSGRRRGNRDPVILERVDEHWLRATIAPVQPGADVTMKISYIGLAESLGGLHAVHLPVPRNRGERGGPLPYSMSGFIAGDTDSLMFLTPGQNLRKLSRKDEGHEFEVSGPGAHKGVASLYYGADEPRDPVNTSCYRTQGEDGYFLMDYDPHHLLAEPLAAASYVIALDLPCATPITHLRRVKEALGDMVRELGDDDRVAVLTPGSGPSARLFRACDENRDAAIARIDDASPRGRTSIPALIAQAAELARSSELPARVLLVSPARGPLDLSGALGCVQELAESEDVTLFTLCMGEADRTSIDKLARFGYGRAFHSPNAHHAEAVVTALTDAARRPVLRHPRLEIAGATEECVDAPRSLSFGDSLRVTGRYHAGGTSLVRLRAEKSGALVDEVYGTVFAEERSATPWVATLWASKRSDQLRNEQTNNPSSAAELRYFETRLCERFGLIGPNTVSFGLEEAMVARMPQLVGPRARGDSDAQLPDSPFQPLGPRPPRSPGGGVVVEAETPQERARRALPTAMRLADAPSPPTIPGAFGVSATRVTTPNGTPTGPRPGAVRPAARRGGR